MKEKFKSIFLAFLVLLSIFLTYLLWYDQGPMEEVTDYVQERTFFEEPRPLDEVIEPEKIIVAAGEELFMFHPGNQRFDMLWSIISSALQNISHFQYGMFQSQWDAQQPFVRLDFNPFLPVGNSTAWLPGDRYRELSFIDLYYVEEELWAVLNEARSDERMVLCLPEARTGLQLNAVLDELWGVNGTKEAFNVLGISQLDLEQFAGITVSEQLYVPAGKRVMPVLQLQKEELELEQLLETFFVERSLVRQIEEKDGAMIFTNGEKGLRVNCGIEYSDVRYRGGKTVLSYPAALNTGNRLLCYYGGWPAGLRFQELTLLQDGSQEYYRARWALYYNGYRLIADRETVEMFFSDNNLLEYCRLIYFPVQEGSAVEVKPYTEALIAAVDNYREDMNDGRNLILENIELLYVVSGNDPDPVAIPAWAVTINGIERFYHAEHLTEIGVLSGEPGPG